MTVGIAGAGKVGLALARMLDATGDYTVRVGDCTDIAYRKAASHGVDARHLDAASPTQLAAFLSGVDIAVAAVPDRIVSRVRAAANESGCHYLDFSMPPATCTEASDPRVLRGCGISPGLADLMVASLASQAAGPVDIALSVGAIPARRTNRLGYSLIWNFDGLFSEYTSLCEAIENFEIVELAPLSRLQPLRLDGVDYEAFCTAGVIAPMAGLAGRNIRNLICRTIRYPGHLDYMQFLLDDLGLRQRRDMLASLLQNGLAGDEEDIVLMHARAGSDNVPAREISIRISATSPFGSALAVGSAAHAAWLIDDIAAQETRQADPGVRLSGFLNSRYARQCGIVFADR